MCAYGLYSWSSNVDAGAIVGWGTVICAGGRCAFTCEILGRALGVVRVEDPAVDVWFFNGERRRARVSGGASFQETEEAAVTLGGGAEVLDLNSSYRRLRGSSGLARR